MPVSLGRPGFSASTVNPLCEHRYQASIRQLRRKIHVKPHQTNPARKAVTPDIDVLYPTTLNTRQLCPVSASL